MSQPAYKFIDKRRGQISYANNQLVPAATQTKDRAPTPRLDYDFHKNVSAQGRRQLLSDGRRLFCNPVVKGAVKEMATCAVATFQRQSLAENVDYARATEQYLADGDKYIDLRGPPFTMSIFRRNLVIAAIRDGDVGIILTEDSNGSPKIQVIPAHRIGQWNLVSNSIVQDGPYDGARIIDGVIVNDYGAAIAYRIMGENPEDATAYQDISTRDMILAFIPEYPDQLRGLSLIGEQSPIFKDVSETDYHERIAQKVGARIYLTEKTVTGNVDPTQQLILTDGDPTNPANPNSAPDANKNAQSLLEENFDDGTIRLLKANSGAAIENFMTNRPGPDSQKFTERQQRYALTGLGWSYDYTVDPNSSGGVVLRVIIDKLNRSVGVIQDDLVMPVCARIDGYRIAKDTKQGRLPEDKDWWRWDYHGPAELTGDAKYDSDIDLQENRAGLKTMKSITAKRGNGYWEDVQDDLINEEARLQSECKKKGVDPLRIRMMTPNGNQAPQQDAQSQPSGKESKP